METHFLEALAEHTAGDPMREQVKWTDLTRREISQRLAERGTPAGKRVVRQLLKKHGYVKRQVGKKVPTSTVQPANNVMVRISSIT